MDAAFSFQGAPPATRDRDRALKWVARRLAGTYRPSGRKRNSTVAWELEKTPAILYFLEDGRTGAEGVAFRIREACSFRIRLLPETGWERVRRFFGAQDIQTGDPAFDRAFIVQADNRSSALSLLAPEVRRSMTNLARFGPMTLEGGPNGFILRSRGAHLEELERLCAFAGESMALGRALLRIREPSMFLAEVECVGTGQCPVCATAIESDGRECNRCRTPHHEDCWTYSGGCAIFACAGRRGGPRTAA